LSQLAIIEYPDPRLKRVARPVTAFDERLRRLVADMAETMYSAPGVGLAATQVDVHERIIVIDVSETKDALHVFINPELLWASEEFALCEEGLSIGARRLRHGAPALPRAGALDGPARTPIRARLRGHARGVRAA